MKNTLFVAILFLLPLFGFSQKKKSIDGFLDIPFGSDSATVKAALIAKGGIKDNLSRKDNLIFTGLSMSDKKVFLFCVRFVDNKAYEADIFFADFDESDVLRYFDSFASDITSVYGKGTLTNNFGNENITTRIKKLKSGNASCSTVWQSKNNNSIKLTFSPGDLSLQVELVYQDDKLWDLNAAKRRADL